MNSVQTLLWFCELVARRELPFMVSNGFKSKKSLKSSFQSIKILEIKVFKAENPWNQGFQGSNSCLTLKSRFSRKMLFAEEWAQIFFSSLQKYAKRLTQHKNEALWAADLGIIEKILLCRKSYKDLLCIFVLEITENLEIKVFKAVWPWFLGFQVYPAVGKWEIKFHFALLFIGLFPSFFPLFLSSFSYIKFIYMENVQVVNWCFRASVS